MDDTTRPRAAFPFQDREIIALRPTEGQAIALSLTRTGGTPEQNTSAVQRIFRVLEKLIGVDEWQRLDDGLIDGDVTIDEVTGLLRAIVTFKWDGDTAEPADTPVREPRRV